MSRISFQVNDDFLERVGYAMEAYDYFKDLCESYFDEDLRDEFMTSLLIVQFKSYVDNIEYGKENIKDYFKRVSKNYVDEDFEGKRKISPDVVSLAASIKTDSDTPERGYSVLQDSITDNVREFNAE